MQKNDLAFIALLGALSSLLIPGGCGFAQQRMAVNSAEPKTEDTRILALALPQIDPASVIFEVPAQNSMNEHTRNAYIAELAVPAATNSVINAPLMAVSAIPKQNPDLRNAALPSPPVLDGSVGSQKVPDIAMLPEAPQISPAPTGSETTNPSTGPSPAIPQSWNEAFAEKLKARLASFPRHREDELDAIEKFYTETGFKPIWMEETGYTAKAASARLTLDKANEQGLNADAYRIAPSGNSVAERVESEIAFSQTIIRYTRDARGARINPRRISTLITAEPSLPATYSTLTELSASADAGATLEAFQPQQPGFQALRRKLNEIRSAFPSALKQEQDIIANMERWRWLPRDLGASYVMVNIPEYQLRMVRDGTIVHQTKVIIGKTETPTPIFSHNMEYLIVNPYWNIPPSIALKEMLPRLQRDPYALQNRGFEVVRGGKVVDPASINWSAGVKGIGIRQPPGERNALGYIKFMFPNDHAVYLHDTPSRGLFSNATRAFSHGCIRVFEPFKFAETLLSKSNGISEQKLRAMIGGPERYIYLKEKIPVHLVYFTAFVDDSGQLQTRADVYGHHRRVKTALGFSN